MLLAQFPRISYGGNDTEMLAGLQILSNFVIPSACFLARGICLTLPANSRFLLFAALIVGMTKL